METTKETLVLVLVASLIKSSVDATCETDIVRDLNHLASRDPGKTSNYWEGGNEPVVSDERLDKGWYRTVHDGWQYTMTDSKNIPSYTGCSTYWPIYLQGKTAQLTQAVTPAPAPDDVNLGVIAVEPHLKFMKKTSLVFKLSQYEPYFTIECRFSNQSELFYTVHWYVADKLLVSLGPSKDQDDLEFHEDILKNKSISLGFHIKCGVSASSSKDGLQTDVRYSNKYFAGIKVLHRTIYLDKGTSASIKMVTTLPIGCRYMDIGGKPRIVPCAAKMNVFVNDTNQKCFAPSVLNQLKKSRDNDQQCAKDMIVSEGEKWNASTVHTFDIVTTDHTYEDGGEFKLRLHFHHDVFHNIWRNYIFPEINVFVQNRKIHKNRICSARIDPHMTTADGYRYEMQLPGIFVLYNNTKYGIEVQQSTKKCNSYATCTCGVAIRAGQDVFMINQCQGPKYLGFTRCGDGGILQVVRVRDDTYKVFTPIGTIVEIKLFLPGIWMNVQITMAPKDYKNVVGLCGTFDNNKHNDLLHGDEKNVSPLGRSWRNFHNTFATSWKLEKIDDRLNLFKKQYRKLSSFTRNNGMYCLCNKSVSAEKAVCGPTQYLECEKTGSMTRTKCHITNRQKRGVKPNRYDKEMERLLSRMLPDSKDNDIHIIGKRQDGDSVTITEEAIAYCAKKINSSLAMTSYTEVSGPENADASTYDCAFDISADNNTSWADAHLESINSAVKNIMDLEPSYVVNNTEKVEFFLKNTCPGNCSNNGNCTKDSVCRCFQFYHGPDCTIDERDPLVIDDIEGGGECDLADGDECECFYVRSNQILEGFKCTVETSKILLNGSVVRISSSMLAGGYEDIFTGLCCAHTNIVGTKDVFVAKYDVTISNNGVNFGNKESVYVFDSTCQNVQTISENNRKFTLKTEHCFIDGACAADREMSLSGCLACQSNIHRYNWTVYNPCRNGGRCLNQRFGYKCMCPDGYEGKNCENETDECASNPCLNGGSCVDHFNKYTCTCASGYEGANCQLETDECLSNPCQNGGTCSDQLNGYNCTCATGFTGAHCDIDVNECVSNPCQNGHVCEDKVNGYLCKCTDGYTGINCGIDINECQSHPCQNGGLCTDRVNGYVCTCPDGFEGTACETDINECLSQPCRNGAECEDHVNRYTCICMEGYNGTHCETNIDECSSNPCENGGKCKDKVNSYTCECSSGYGGVHCESEVDECLSNPCQNDGQCIDSKNRYICTCAEGYTGSQCQIHINECASSPCKNSGSCMDYVNNYKCTCTGGYTGDNCQIDIDECASNPCQNNGSCLDNVNEYSCMCSKGYGGSHCQTDMNECASNPCKNGGSCVDDVNGYICTCLKGYNGSNCETEIDECASNPCQNNGNCFDNVNGYSCMCTKGYAGIHCQTDVNECASSPCKNGGSCTDEINGYICTCLKGYNGRNCEANMNECASNPCKNGGSCIDEVNGYICTCLTGYNGISCETDVIECASSPCKNGGSCTDEINGYICTCLKGYNGRNCEANVNECASSPCKNGGSCMDEVNGYICTCLKGYNGINCETDIDECASDPCQNNGSCFDKVNGYNCMCTKGYGGTHCQTDVKECVSYPCKNGGSCVDKVNGYICTCLKGYNGRNCETNIDECSSNPCFNTGSCIDEEDGYMCNCSKGYTGIRCQIDIDECASDPCQNNGGCLDIVSGYTCMCSKGYDGTHCQTDIDECISDPCLNNGRCLDQVDGYTCMCMKGYNGTHCQTDIDECLSKPCLNGGKCLDHVNGYTCFCLPGYIGTHCQTDIDECASTPCRNGGICVDEIDAYMCMCKDGYSGTQCQHDVNECDSNPCHNGGKCEDEVNSYSCTCTKGYKGNHCETDIDECISNPCMNGGSCLDKIEGYSCLCPEGYGDTLCQKEIPKDLKIVNVKLVFPTRLETIYLADTDLKQKIENQLANLYRRRLEKSFRRVSVLSLNHGSLIINYVAEYENSQPSSSEFTKIAIDLISGKEQITIFNESMQALSVEVGHVTVTRDSINSSSKVCDLFHTTNGQCTTDSTCSLIDGKPECVKIEVKSEFPYLYVIIAAGSTVFVILIVTAIGVFVRKFGLRKHMHHVKNVTKRSKQSDDKHGILHERYGKVKSMKGSGKRSSSSTYNVDQTEDKMDGNELSRSSQTSRLSKKSHDNKQESEETKAEQSAQLPPGYEEGTVLHLP